MHNRALIRRGSDPGAIGEAVRALRAGKLVGMPTETVYGLAGDATNGRAVAAIFEAKGRPRFNPLIVHVADLEAARRLGTFDDLSLRLARAFWPGPLTLVVPRAGDCPVSLLASAGLDTVALRVPAHPVARLLLKAVEVPLAAPSANPSGRVSPTTAAHVAEQLGDKVALILDGGRCRIGLESTIVTVRDGAIAILRPGGVTRESLARAAGVTIERHEGGARPTAPGQLRSHYAPRAPLRLEATTVEPGEALLAFGPEPPPTDGPMLNLSPDGDLAEAAANLFSHLRALDREDVTAIAVMPVPGHGLGEAINDRLRRAAAPRPA